MNKTPWAARGDIAALVASLPLAPRLRRASAPAELRKETELVVSLSAAVWPIHRKMMAWYSSSSLPWLPDDMAVEKIILILENGDGKGSNCALPPDLPQGAA